MPMQVPEGAGFAHAQRRCLMRPRRAADDAAVAVLPCFLPHPPLPSTEIPRTRGFPSSTSHHQYGRWAGREVCVAEGSGGVWGSVGACVWGQRVAWGSVRRRARVGRPVVWQRAEEARSACRGQPANVRSVTT